MIARCDLRFWFNQGAVNIWCSDSTSPCAEYISDVLREDLLEADIDKISFFTGAQYEGRPCLSSRCYLGGSDFIWPVDGQDDCWRDCFCVFNFIMPFTFVPWYQTQNPASFQKQGFISWAINFCRLSPKTQDRACYSLISWRSFSFHKKLGETLCENVITCY